jgi:hypothetical protein
MLLDRGVARSTEPMHNCAVTRQYRDAVDTLRKQELRRLKKELPKAAQDTLKDTLWPFRKRSAALDDAEQDRLGTLEQRMAEAFVNDTAHY